MAEFVTGPDELVVGKLQLVVDQPDFTFLNRSNHLVSGGNGKEAFQQSQSLLEAGHVFELLSDKEVLSTAEQSCLCFGDLDDKDGLFLGKTAQANDLTLHLSRFHVADVHVGSRYPTQDVSKSSNEAGAVRLEIVELPHDLSDCLCFISTQTAG